MSAVVGSVYRWKRDALGIPGQAVGMCYARGETRVGLIFDNGVPATLSDYDLNRYAESLGRAPDLSNYTFSDLNQLLNDFGRGLFDVAFRGRMLDRANSG